MGSKISKAEFDALVEAHGLEIVKTDSDRYAVVERAVDAQGLTRAAAVYERGVGTFIGYGPTDLVEFIVVEGVVWGAGAPEAQEALSVAEQHGRMWQDTIRVYAVDHESALALAQAFEDGQVSYDNTPLGEPGVVQPLD